MLHSVAHTIEGLQHYVAPGFLNRATFCSVDWKEEARRWRERARALKDASGLYDADIAAAVLELREARGDERKLTRAAVNHWITRQDREPNIQDFLDWCLAVQADPRYVLFNIGSASTDAKPQRAAPRGRTAASIPRAQRPAKPTRKEGKA